MLLFCIIVGKSPADLYCLNWVPVTTPCTLPGCSGAANTSYTAASVSGGSGKQGILVIEY